jgi:hypothetical protein
MSLENDITQIKTLMETKDEFKDYEDLSPERQIKKHIEQVETFMNKLSAEIKERGRKHDASKLGDQELPKWEDYLPKLAGMKYGTLDYKKASEAMGDVIKIHHKANRHHPEYFSDGMKGMNLVDLCELCADWASAALRTNGGNIEKSIDDNKKRFNYDNTLASILKNTVKLFKENNNE